MSEQVESKATENETTAAVDAAEETVADVAEAAADMKDAIDETVAEVAAEAEAVEQAAEEMVDDAIAEAEAVEAAVEETVTEAVAEAAAIEEAAEEAVADVIAEGADDETFAEAVAQAAEIEEAAEEVVAEVAETAAEIEQAAQETAAEAVAEAAALEAAVEEQVDAVVAEAAEIEADVDETVAEVVNHAAAAEAAEAPAAESATEGDLPADGEEADDGSTRVVRVLSVGMEVDGNVKRITDFGAFIDIGVGRDGLVHISEMSVRRVAKVSDVLKEGQPVKAWIKQLDRERNRISLTLIPPGVVTIRDLEKGELVQGTVTRIVPYGAFVDIGVGRDALLHIREMAEGYVKRPEDVVQVGEEIEARIIDLSKRRGRIDLSIKGLRPEPEPEEPTAEAVQEAQAGEEELEDPFADVEVLSPIELAFQKAMAENEDEVTGMRKKKGKRARKAEQRAIQDEIISRTLDGR